MAVANPYYRAQSIFSEVIRRLESTEIPPVSNVIENLTTGNGDAYVYSVLFCALARKSGIPARPVAGHIIDKRTKSHRHFWADFYLEEFGWVPVDPFLGDGARYGDFPDQKDLENIEPRNYYFGNIDNHHISFSRGLVSIPAQNPHGRRIMHDRMYSLQTVHEEVAGEIESYNTEWTVSFGVY